MKVTRSNRVSVTEQRQHAPTVHPQEYDTDKGGGQLDYVISAKRRHYYEYALGVQADLIDGDEAEDGGDHDGPGGDHDHGWGSVVRGVVY